MLVHSGHRNLQYETHFPVQKRTFHYGNALSSTETHYFHHGTHFPLYETHFPRRNALPSTETHYFHYGTHFPVQKLTFSSTKTETPLCCLRTRKPKLGFRRGKCVSVVVSAFLYRKVRFVLQISVATVPPYTI